MAEEAEAIETTDEIVAEPEIVEPDGETIEEESEETAEQEEQPSDSSTEKPKKGVQKRIDELTGTIREERELRLKAEQDAAYLRQLSEQAKSIPLEPGKTLADFDYDEQKFSAYIVEQAKAEAVKHVQQETEAQAQIRRRVEFNAKEADFSKDKPDYMAKTRSPTLRITPVMANIVQQSDNGPELLLHLAEHRSLTNQLSQLPPDVQIFELGKIADKLATPVQKPVTTAPKPPKTLKGVNEKAKKEPHEMTQAEFEAHRRKVIANR